MHSGSAKKRSIFHLIRRKPAKKCIKLWRNARASCFVLNLLHSTRLRIKSPENKKLLFLGAWNLRSLVYNWSSEVFCFHAKCSHVMKLILHVSTTGRLLYVWKRRKFKFNCSLYSLCWVYDILKATGLSRAEEGQNDRRVRVIKSVQTFPWIV